MTATDAEPLGWRERAVSRGMQIAQSRAEERVQRFLDAAFDLVDEKGTTEFTIQEVVDRSKQSLRGFYEYFDGKEELMLALFEETARACERDIRAAVDSEADPLLRLRAFTIRLHDWSDPGQARNRRAHNRRAISEFSMQLAVNDAVRAALRPCSHLLRDLIEAANESGAIRVTDTRQAAAMVQQTVMASWFGNRLVEDPALELTAEQTWEFCRHGLGRDTRCELSS